MRVMAVNTKCEKNKQMHIFQFLYTRGAFATWHTKIKLQSATA